MSTKARVRNSPPWTKGSLEWCAALLWGSVSLSCDLGGHPYVYTAPPSSCCAPCSSKPCPCSGSADENGPHLSLHCRVCSWTSVCTAFQMQLCGRLLHYALFGVLFAGTMEIVLDYHTLGTVLLHFFHISDYFFTGLIMSPRKVWAWTCQTVSVLLFPQFTIIINIFMRNCCLIDNS